MSPAKDVKEERARAAAEESSDDADEDDEPALPPKRTESPVTRKSSSFKRQNSSTSLKVNLEDKTESSDARSGKKRVESRGQGARKEGMKAAKKEKEEVEVKLEAEEEMLPVRKSGRTGILIRPCDIYIKYMIYTYVKDLRNTESHNDLL